MKRFLFLVCVLLSLVLVLASCSFDFEVSDKNFIFEDMRITLTDEFSEAEQNGFDMCFLSQEVAVVILREEFSDDGFSELAEDASSLSLTEYAGLVLDNNPELESGVSDINEDDGFVWFEYDASVDEYTYSNFVSLYKSSDSFWLVDFYCLDTLYDANRADIIKWASAVTFVDSQS